MTKSRTMTARDLLILIDGRVEVLRNASMSDDRREVHFDKYLESDKGRKLLNDVLDQMDVAVAAIILAQS